MDHGRELLGRVLAGLVVGALFLVVAYVATQFVAVVVFGIFLYYAVRPIHRFLERFGLPRRLRAMLALVLFGVPFVVLVTYTVAIVIFEAQTFFAGTEFQAQTVDVILEQLDLGELEFDELRQGIAGVATQASLSLMLVSLASVIGTVSSAVVQLLVLVTVTYYMLVDGPRFVSWLLDRYDGSGVGRAYVRAVDPELSATMFGNIVNVFVTAIVAIATFYTYNALVPSPVEVPFPALVGALAGVGSLIPVVGIKLVYVPVTILLATNAWLSGDLSLLVPVAVLFAVSAVIVDFIPDFFIRAHVSGDETHTGMLLVSYIVGPIVFGFYGLFLAPILLILVINAVYVLLPYALSGDAPGVRQSRLHEFEDGRGGPSADERAERAERERVAPGGES